MIMKVGMKSGSAYYQKFPKNLQPLCKISGPGLKKVVGLPLLFHWEQNKHA